MRCHVASQHSTHAALSVGSYLYMCEYLYVYIHSIYREKRYRRSLVLICHSSLRGYTRRDRSYAAVPSRASASSEAPTVQTPELTRLQRPGRSPCRLRLPGRSAERESRDTSPFSLVKDCNRFSLPPHAMIPSKSGEEQSSTFYHQMPRKGLKYSFGGIPPHL